MSTQFCLSVVLIILVASSGSCLFPVLFGHCVHLLDHRAGRDYLQYVVMSGFQTRPPWRNPSGSDYASLAQSLILDVPFSSTAQSGCPMQRTQGLVAVLHSLFVSLWCGVVTSDRSRKGDQSWYTHEVNVTLARPTSSASASTRLHVVKQSQ